MRRWSPLQPYPANIRFLSPKPSADDLHWKAGQEVVFIPKGKGVLLMPVPELEQLAGMAEGAQTEGYRDRQDRY